MADDICLGEEWRAGLDSLAPFCSCVFSVDIAVTSLAKGGWVALLRKLV